MEPPLHLDHLNMNVRKVYYHICIHKKYEFDSRIQILFLECVHILVLDKMPFLYMQLHILFKKRKYYNITKN